MKEDITKASVSVGNDTTRARQAEEERLRIEERFRIVTQSAADAIIFTDHEHNIMFCNRDAQKLYGYSEQEMLGKPVSILIPAGKLEADQKIFTDTVSRGALPLQGKPFESVALGKDGREFPVETSLPVGVAGTEIFYCAIIRDLSERKASEEGLHQSRKMETVGTLAGGIAHKFNNILGGIIGYTELAQDDTPDGSPVREILDEIVKLCGRARDIVKQILSFSRKSPINTKRLQPHISINESIKLLRNIIPSSTELRTAIHDCGTLVADATHLQQVGMNLCNNAVHAMQEAGGVLEISLSPVFLDTEAVKAFHNIQPGHYVQLAVSDTGTGIAPAIIDRIFDPFFTTKTVGKETGMGLALTHGIVSKHDGAICVANRDNGPGTTFRVVLPAIERRVRPEDNQRPADLPGGTERILIVDDDEFMVRPIKKYWKKWDTSSRS